MQSSLPSHCPFQDCPGHQSAPEPSLRSRRIVRKGFFRRRSDGATVARFQCKACRRSFSSATSSPCYWQKKRYLNEPVLKLLSSGVSQRRIAKIFEINLKTVERKLLFLASQAKLAHARWLASASKEAPFHEIQFDEMESSERSKLLPLSIPLVVDARTRRVLGFRICSMPAKGPLAEMSRKKYGLRPDHRAKAAKELFRDLKAHLREDVQILSDENPRYPAWIGATLPQASHRKVKGRRGAVVGQGELKKIGFDPLFALNHTCAMLRADINRLFRRTWCTTKRADRLDAHLSIYIYYRNTNLIA